MMYRFRLPLSACCLVTLLSAAPAWAASPPFGALAGPPAAQVCALLPPGGSAAAPAAPASCAVVSDSRLAEMRGGFVAGLGLSVSFGFRRVVEINGELAAESAFYIADLGRISAEEIAALQSVFERPQLIQNGSGNIFQSPSAMGGLFIQNTLDSQKIRVDTQVFTMSNSLHLLRHHNALLSVREALSGF